MQQDDTQKIALEVRTISATLGNLEASRKRHDEKLTERFESMYTRFNTIDAESKIMGQNMAVLLEFKNTISSDLKSMKESIDELTAMGNRAKGSWATLAAMGTVFAAIGSGITMLIDRMIK